MLMFVFVVNVYHPLLKISCMWRGIWYTVYAVVSSNEEVKICSCFSGAYKTLLSMWQNLTLNLVQHSVVITQSTKTLYCIKYFELITWTCLALTASWKMCRLSINTENWDLWCHLCRHCLFYGNLRCHQWLHSWHYGSFWFSLSEDCDSVVTGPHCDVLPFYQPLQ